MSGRPGLRRRAARDRRWVEVEGIGRALEEKDVSTSSVRAALERRRWKARHRDTGTASIVWIVGLQRSGTNMLVRSFRSAPEFQIYNEGDRRAFRHYLLRDQATIARLVARTRAEFAAFKPLCDSHRTGELLDDPLLPGGKAIWVYRSVDGRIRSAVSRFGTTARDALVEVARGSEPMPWQGFGLSQEAQEFVRSVAVEDLSIESAHGLLWYVRNELFFDLHLDERTDVSLCSYDRLVANPDEEMRRVCGFLGARYRSELVADIEPRRVGDAPLDLDPRIRERCEELTERLERHWREQMRRSIDAA